MGNTVGRTNANFCNANKNVDHSYILGLWFADGYYWSSSFGLTNVNPDLINKFRKFLTNNFIPTRIKLKIYLPPDSNYKLRSDSATKIFYSAKAKQPAYQIYVNSRPLLREFQHWRTRVIELDATKNLWSYFAGRFDGDGSIDKKFDRDCRIVYARQNEIKIDRILLKRLGLKPKIYYYRSAKTYCLYIPRTQTNLFLSGIYPYSVRMQKLAFVPRRDFSLKRVS